MDFFDADALLDRLTEGLSTDEKEIVFVVGSPLTASHAKMSGVLNVEEVTDLIRNRFLDSSQLTKLDQALRSSTNKYQAAFDFLKGRRSPSVAESIVKTAVLSAHNAYDFSEGEKSTDIPTDEVLSKLDNDKLGWSLSPGVSELGRLISENKNLFGQHIITSNFDPLIEVAIKKSDGNCWQTLLYTDGDIRQSRAEGSQVIHIHGYWHGADCLHTGNQLTQNRPALESSISEIIKNKIVVVIAYGGWEDVFTNTLGKLVTSSNEFPEIIWTFYDEIPELNDNLKSLLQPGLNRNRVSLYSGIDCHDFFPKLTAYWSKNRTTQTLDKVKTNTVLNSTKKSLPPISLPKLDSDRPPTIEFWVGRFEQLSELDNSDSKVVAITGLGGEGKSALAAKYLEKVSNGETQFVHTDWRDCKEQGNRIRTQICFLIKRLSNEEISVEQLDQSNDDDLIEILVRLTTEVSAVIVFDNVDHYVDFGSGKYIGILDKLVRVFSTSETKSRLIITCRPEIKYTSSSIISIRLGGLPIEAIIELYEARNGVGKIDKSVIQKAFEYTDGHAFWNDLLAAQVARKAELTLEELLENIQRGRSEAPDILSPIWDKLPDREKTVLQVLSETVRPETEETLQNMISSELRYNRFKKALDSLNSMNLIVRKFEQNSPDLFDLHPLVRQFVRTNFVRSERLGYIQIVLNQYAVIISGLGKMLGVHLPQSLLERYSQKAELEIEAGLFQEAFETLSMSESALIGSGHLEEFIRVAHFLFTSLDWELNFTEIKKFDEVLFYYTHCLCLHQRYEEADSLLNKFEAIVPANTARYIGFCDAKCNSYWLRKDYINAIHWGELGQKLKADSQIDTLKDSSHNLALARRDGGDPETALKFFLKKYSIEDLTNPKGIEGLDDGASLGNIGRCLQLQGKHEQALTCFKKSIVAIDKENTSSRKDNQGWARQWIAESLTHLGLNDLAYIFYKDAIRVLISTAPGRVNTIETILSSLDIEDNLDDLSEYEITRRINAWIKS